MFVFFYSFAFSSEICHKFTNYDFDQTYLRPLVNLLPCLKSSVIFLRREGKFNGEKERLRKELENVGEGRLNATAAKVNIHCLNEVCNKRLLMNTGNLPAVGH